MLWLKNLEIKIKNAKLRNKTLIATSSRYYRHPRGFLVEDPLFQPGITFVGFQPKRLLE